MQVIINNRRVNLGERDVLGSGGEAVVFGHKNLAVKIYHNPGPARSAKLLDLLRLPAALPPAVIMPQQPVYDLAGQNVIGFTMDSVPERFLSVTSLRNKAFRATHGFNNRQVAELFLAIHTTLQQIHAAGLVIGDFNELNLLFVADKPVFIDVDSYQYGPYACPVATEAFLDPQLYGLDLAASPVFRPEHDWYSYAVLLFRSLLLAHPFGGTHPKVKKLVERAESGLYILGSEVTYPIIAYSPWLLSDELSEVFKAIFAGKERSIFPAQKLADFAQSLVECVSCRNWFPAKRRLCPLCQPTANFSFSLPTQVAGLEAGEWLTAGGQIVACQVFGEKIYLLAREADTAVLYIIRSNRLFERSELFRWLPGATYSFMADCLVVNPFGSTELLLLEMGESGQIKPLFKTSTGRFEGQAVFATTARYLYRLAGGMLMQGELKNGQMVERPLSAVLEDQTRFSAFQEGTGESIIGFSRVFKNYEWFCLGKEGRSVWPVTPLEADETMLDFSIKPGGAEDLLIRQTRQAGLDYVRLDVVSSGGLLVLAKRRRVEETDGLENPAKGLFRAGVAVWPGSKGLLKERLSQGQRVELSAAGPFLNEASTLLGYQDGLLAVTDNRLWKLTIA